MHAQGIQPKLGNSRFFYEKTIIYSLLFLLIVFTFDCFIQKLPVSDYGLIFITLFFITLTTCVTCHLIKWAITSNKPIHYWINQKSSNSKLAEIITKCENRLFKHLIGSSKCGFTSFQYPTSLNEQIRLLLKDIEQEFIKTWYYDISQDPSFLLNSHTILEEFFLKLIEKLQKCNFKNLIIRVLTLYLTSLQEYKKSIKKYSKVCLNNKGDNIDVKLSDMCRYFHPGSQSDKVLNYYIKKVTRVVIKEFFPYEFSNSLECKLLSGIIGRKVIRKLLVTLEDPTWIYINLIYLVDVQRHKDITNGKLYVVKDKNLISDEGECQFQKKLSFGKRYMATNLFERNDEFGEPKITTNNSNASYVSLIKTREKESLTLPVSPDQLEKNKGNISTALTGLFSSTAGPLLPDNISVRYKALNKMWLSPVAEAKDITEFSTASSRKVFANGIKERKGFIRSKSTESLSSCGEPELKVRDISVGEDLCESAEFGTVKKEFSGANSFLPPKGVRKLTKTHSFCESASFEDEAATNEGIPRRNEENTVPGVENHGEVSPVYEETEDFATTIAKLRSLLQQRESSSTLSDKSSLSVDSQSAAEKSNSSNRSQSSEGESSDSQVACDLPADGRIFLNVSIPKGELMAESGNPHVVYTIQYDGIYVLKAESNYSEPELVLQTTVVRRRFRDFLQLHLKLDGNSDFRAAMKGIKGPSTWLSLSSEGQIKESFSRKAMLENFLRQICSKAELSNSPELHEFLAYGQSGNGALIKKGSESSSQRIDKLLANKVTGVFNSIKTVLPSLVDFDSPAFIATTAGDNSNGKNIQEQKLLQGFLNFGNKTENFEINLNFIGRDQTGDSLVDDIRHYFGRKSEGVEDAIDVLDSSDWLADPKDCKFLTPEESCVWENFRDAMAEDDTEALDSSLPVYSLLIDIASELVQNSDCWAAKEPVVRLIKVMSGHWESKLAEELSKCQWDRIVGNFIRLLRATVFHSPPREPAEISAEDVKESLKKLILDLIPSWGTEFITAEGLTSAVSLFVDSLENFRLNRDVILRLMDILLVHVLSCRHLNSQTADANLKISI